MIHERIVGRLGAIFPFSLCAALNNMVGDTLLRFLLPLSLSLFLSRCVCVLVFLSCRIWILPDPSLFFLPGSHPRCAGLPESTLRSPFSVAVVCDVFLILFSLVSTALQLSASPSCCSCGPTCCCLAALARSPCGLQWPVCPFPATSLGSSAWDRLCRLGSPS